MTDHNIAQALYQVAAGREDKVALVTREGGAWREWRFRDLLAGCAGYGLLLQARGVRRGDRVMLMVRPSLAFVCLTFALFFMVNTPDDMARIHLGAKHVTPESIARWKTEHGYDKPLFWNAQASGSAASSGKIGRLVRGGVARVFLADNAIFD